MVDKLKALARSRRFWATIAVAVMTPILEGLGCEQETITTMVGIVAVWIIGDSLNKTT